MFLYNFFTYSTAEQLGLIANEGVTSIEVYGTAAAEPTYNVTFKEGTEDVGNWTIDPASAKQGQTVTVKYNGTKKVKSVKAVVKAAAEPVTLATPLTVEAITAGTIVVNIGGTLSTGMKYSLDGGQSKTTITTTTNIPVSAGQKVQFYGNGTSTKAYGNSPEVKLLGNGDGFKTKVYGNIMSLVDETGYETAKAVSGDYVFWGLFRGNTTLIDASGLLLPATTLAKSCYTSMFNGCSALTTAPELPAKTLVDFCYSNMFNGCSNLSSVTCLATSGINVNSSTSNWLSNAGKNVTGTKTFKADANATWPEGNNGIPSGWTRVNK